MNKIFITCFLFQLFTLKISAQQYIFYDADSLSNLLDKKGYFNENANSILAKYGISGSTKNPFLVSFFSDSAKSVKSLISDKLTYESPEASSSGFGLGTVVDGFAKFLVKRTKEELSITFINEFKTSLGKYPEFKILFPTTERVLSQVDAYYYTSILNGLKEAFEIDIRNLPINIRGLSEISVSDCAGIESDDSNNCNNRIKEIQKKFSTQEGKVLIAGSILAEELISGNNVAFALSKISTNRAIKDDNHMISQTIKIMNLFSQSLLSKEKNRIWIGDKEINSLLFSPNTFRIYLGLIYQVSEMEKLKLVNSDFHKELGKFSNKMDNLKSYFQSVITVFNTLDSEIERLDLKKKSGTEVTFEDYLQYFVKSFNVIEEMLELSFLDSYHWDPNEVRKYYKHLRSLSEIYLNIKSKNYNAAILNTTYVFSELKILDAQVVSDIIKYGIFAANLAQAKNSDEVSEIIEATVLPSGSSSIKKNSRFNVSLNSYLGIFGGYEEVIENKQGSGVCGISAPIGISVNWGHVLGSNSFSIFASVFDIGAVTAYRWTNTAEGLPSIEFENIIAPGLHFIWGFSDYPISFGLGVQVSPSLRSISTEDPENPTATITDSFSAYRISAQLSVDIPLLNFYTNP